MPFKTQRYRMHARDSYGRMGDTTLRRTGLEPLMEEAIRRGKEIVLCNLGEPPAYEAFPPYDGIFRALAKYMDGPELQRKVSRYAESSFGIPQLRKMLQKWSAKPDAYDQPDEMYSDVFTAVTSGASQAALATLAPQLLKPTDAVISHDFTYIIYPAATYERCAHMMSYDLQADGQPSAASLREQLATDMSDYSLRSAIFTTTGNPVSTATTRANCVAHFRAVEEFNNAHKNRKTLVTLVDTAYEWGRLNPDEIIDPIRVAKEENIRIPIADMVTFSKIFEWCGFRVGGMRLWWPEEVDPDYRHDYMFSLENKILPTLGSVPMIIQLALNDFLEAYANNTNGERERTAAWLESYRRRSNKTQVQIMRELQKVPGVFLSKYCLDGHHNIVPERFTSIYGLFGFSRLLEMGRNPELSQPMALGRFGNETDGAAFVRSVPGDFFLTHERRALHPEYIRIVPLLDDAKAETFLRTVRMFADKLG